MRRFLIAVPFLAALVAAGAARAPVAAVVPCSIGRAPSEYAASVQRAVESGPDLWGGQLLRSPVGPTYAAARRFLAPLLHATQRQQRPLTPSGFYYVPFSFPYSAYGSTVFALHVADGSQIITRHVGGPSLSIYVGLGRERYGACPTRLQAAKLADGYLPIMQTSYVDGHGVRYRQESFVGRAGGIRADVRSVVSFVRLQVDTRRARTGAVIRLVPSKLYAHTAADRLGSKSGARFVFSPGAQVVDGVVRYRVARGTTATIYAQWLNQPSKANYLHADAATYATARAVVTHFWEQRLSAGAQFEVPEPAVGNAELGILSQAIAFGWRYSVGNPYEELSFAEALDSAETMTAYGYPDVAKAVMKVALTRLKQKPQRFTAFRAGHVLSTAAFYYRLTRDRAFVQQETPELEHIVAGIAARRLPSGRLRPEPLSSDIPYSVDSVVAQIEAWQGLLAIERVWGLTGHPGLAARARELAFDIAGALRPALRHELHRLPDGSLFVPDALTGIRGPFARLTKSREGSYWNLVMPYALAAGFFPAHSSAARGIVRYLLAHGSRMLGVPRSDAHITYSNLPYGSGLGAVYGLSTSRFLADNDQPDQIVLSLYGMLAIGMTEGTYISGEAISVVPVNGTYYRTMYMPPNAGANASYLETLRLALVHERRGRSGAPAGLDLAFSTPRAWLRAGQRIAVTNAPTSFGKVTYEIARSGSTIDVHLTLPEHAHTRLRLRVPTGERVSSVALGAVRLPVDAAGTVDLGARHGAVAFRATVARA